MDEPAVVLDASVDVVSVMEDVLALVDKRFRDLTSGLVKGIRGDRPSAGGERMVVIVGSSHDQEVFERIRSVLGTTDRVHLVVFDGVRRDGLPTKIGILEGDHPERSGVLTALSRAFQGDMVRQWREPLRENGLFQTDRDRCVALRCEPSVFNGMEIHLKDEACEAGLPEMDRPGWQSPYGPPIRRGRRR